MNGFILFPCAIWQVETKINVPKRCENSRCLLPFFVARVLFLSVFAFSQDADNSSPVAITNSSTAHFSVFPNPV